jgi:hypothetical protein
MEIQHLYAHAAYPSRAIDELWMEVSRPDRERLDLRYIAAGRVAEVLLPPAQPAERTDELWRSTCFELFLKPVGRQSYWEFNFSPSTRWAAYAFQDRRTGMRDLPLASAPTIMVQREAKRLVFDVSLTLPPLGDVNAMGLSAIIEDDSGSRSFWALAHPAGEPDFHDPACFAADLPAPDRA